MGTVNSMLAAIALAQTNGPADAPGDAQGNAAALGPLAALLMLLITIGVVSVVVLLVLWRVRAARRGGLRSRAPAGDRRDPWFEAGQRAEAADPDDEAELHTDR